MLNDSDVFAMNANFFSKATRVAIPLILLDKKDVFRLQTDQLIESYLSKPLGKQDSVEGARSKTQKYS
jgi:hypothetical protein